MAGNSKTGGNKKLIFSFVEAGGGGQFRLKR
jgi:hypothetical protein